MIEEYQPPINVDELMKKIQEEIAKRKNLSAEYEIPKESKTARNKLILGQVKKFLKAAENRSVTRTKWPDKLNKFPFSISLIVKPFILKALSALFKDQREVNQNVIAAVKLSLIINEQLVQEIESLREELRQAKNNQD